MCSTSEYESLDILRLVLYLVDIRGCKYNLYNKQTYHPHIQHLIFLTEKDVFFFYSKHNVATCAQIQMCLHILLDFGNDVTDMVLCWPCLCIESAHLKISIFQILF